MLQPRKQGHCLVAAVIRSAEREQRRARQSPEQRRTRTMPAQKQYTRAEVAARNTKEDAVFVIENLVYDVTPFLDEHPGGHEVLLRVAGADATEDFDDIGHSLDAKELMKKYQIGEVVPDEHVEVAKREYKWEDVKSEGEVQWLSWRLPLIAAVLASLTWLYFQ